MMETYHGHVRTPADAIKLFEACRLGILPRVQRRLSEKERQSIRSGSVFVWDEREAGMRRWTDGKSWSASRVSGSFLTYREMEGKRGGGNFVPQARRGAGKTPDSGRGSDEDGDQDMDGPDGYRYKPDGLMKQSFSITASTGQHLHLISYYSRPTNGQELMQPTQDPALRHIVPVKGMYPESTVHEQSPGPAITRAPMQSAPGYMPHPHAAQSMHSSPMQGNRPPYGYQVAPGYNNWPPSPVSTPPYSYPAYNAQMPQPHSQPPSSHGSPHQYHSIQPPSLPGLPLPTAFDRPPPPLHETTLPPPPPTLLHRAVTAAGSQASIPVYAPNPSPRFAQARLIAEQHSAQQAAQLALQQAREPSQSATESRTGGLSVTSLMSGPPPIQSGTITSRSPHTPPLPQPITPGHSSLNGSPASEGFRPELKLPPAGQSIPSISSLVSGSDSRNLSSAPGSRSGSRSPRGEGPKDIPHDKLNFGEDMRALNVLNRKFCL